MYVEKEASGENPKATFGNKKDGNGGKCLTDNSKFLNSHALNLEM